MVGNPSNIVACCDGTWCGDIAGTRSNVKIVANSFAGQEVDDKQAYVREYNNTKTIVRYFSGIGVTGPGASFADYITDAVLAIDIEERCIEAYEFIVNNYKPGDKVWLFGLSRGAYTVRCVAGMVNNCGILDRSQFSAVDLKAACNEVYKIYRNPDPEYNPKSAWIKTFKDKYSFKTDAPPIKFLGLFDTVGALGVPHLNPGSRLSYELYDTNVSSDVQHVYQALATHDRFAAFTPCFARRSPEASQKYPNVELTLVERWFPGAHYDIGRQRFIFGRNVRGLERMLHRVLEFTNLLHTNVTFTLELSNAPLLFILEGVQKVDPYVLPRPPSEYIPRPEDDPEPWTWRLPFMAPYRKNAYDAILSSVAAKMIRVVPFINGVLQRVFSDQALADRHIPLNIQARFDGDTVPGWDGRFRSVPSGMKSRTFDTYALMSTFHDGGNGAAPLGNGPRN